VVVAQLRVVVLDRQRTFADVLAARLDLEDDITAAGTVLPASPDTGFVTSDLVTAGPADVVLLDGDLPGDAALELCSELVGQPGGPRVIVLSDTSQPRRIVRALRAGASAWVRKDETLELLLSVLRSVARGDMWLPPAETGRVLRVLLSGDDEPAGEEGLFAALTPREREVLVHLAHGAGRRDVAETLHLSGNTVRTHLQNLMAKLGVHSTLEAVVLARSWLEQRPGPRRALAAEHTPCGNQAHVQGATAMTRGGGDFAAPSGLA
jgi:DNA-binding NarL/FixJ family response regulator